MPSPDEALRLVLRLGIVRAADLEAEGLPRAHLYRLLREGPAEVWLGIAHKARAPQMPHTRVRFVRFSGRAATYGIQPIRFEGVPARITSPARTVVDCFRFERLVGRETCIEALRDALRGRKVSTDAL